MTLEATATQGSPASAAPTEGAPSSSQAPQGDAAAPPGAAAPEQDMDLEWSRRFNQLTKREKMILEEKRKANEMRTKWEAEQKAREARERKKKENPFDWLKEEGMTYEELTQFALSGGQVTPEERIAALEAKIEQDKLERQTEAERIAKERQEAEDNYITQKFQAKIGEVVKATPDFELVASYGTEGIQMIHEVMEAYHDANDGAMMTIEEAAAQCEAYLEKELERVVKSTNKVKKFLPQFEQPSSDTTHRRPNDMSDDGGLDTLSHESAMAPPGPNDSGEMLSNEESIRRAAETLRRLTAGR